MAILIVANNNDHSTQKVEEWLNFYKRNYKKYNFSKLCNQLNLTYRLNTKEETLLLDWFEQDKIPFKKIWFRSDTHKFSFDKTINDFEQLISKYCNEETETLKRSIYNKQDDVIWLSNYKSTQLDKLDMLKQAKKCGLKIPDTLVTSSKKELINFQIRNTEIICKAAYENISHIKTAKGYLKQYVSLVNDEFIKNLPETFFLSLFQKRIQKEYEVKCFFIKGQFYSMAIFNEKLDLKEYSENQKCVPFELPSKEKKSLLTLIDGNNLNIACIDLIKSKEDGSFYFLEVNPNGQYGMISEPCNYYLDKIIAEYLCDEKK